MSPIWPHDNIGTPHQSRGQTQPRNSWLAGPLAKTGCHSEVGIHAPPSQNRRSTSRVLWMKKRKKWPTLFPGGAKIHFSAIFFPFRAGGPIWGLYRLILVDVSDIFYFFSARGGWKGGSRRKGEKGSVFYWNQRIPKGTWNDNSHETTQNLMLLVEFMTRHFTAVGSDFL